MLYFQPVSILSLVHLLDRCSDGRRRRRITVVGSLGVDEMSQMGHGEGTVDRVEDGDQAGHFLGRQGAGLLQLLERVDGQQLVAFHVADGLHQMPRRAAGVTLEDDAIPSQPFEGMLPRLAAAAALHQRAKTQHLVHVDANPCRSLASLWLLLLLDRIHPQL